MKNFVLVALVMSGLAVLQSEPNNLQEKNESQFLAVGFEKRGGVRDFFDNLSNDDIEKYKTHESLKLSIFAAWIRCKEQCLENKSQKENYQNRFVGFLEGRLYVSPPNWWRRELFSIGIEKKIELPKLEENQEYFSESLGINHTNSLSLASVSDSEVSGVKDGTKFRLTWDRANSLLSRDVGVFDLGAIDVLRLNDGRIIWAIAPQGKSKFEVYCLSNKGEELWKVSIDSSRHHNIGGRLGLKNGFLELAVNKDTVLVFGANEVNLYIDGFTLKSGKPEFHFTTLY